MDGLLLGWATSGVGYFWGCYAMWDGLLMDGYFWDGLLLGWATTLGCLSGESCALVWGGLLLFWCVLGMCYSEIPF